MSMFSKLPWNSGGGEQQQQHEEEQSLTSVLPTPQARSDLTLLVANCTETMRKGITDTFDPNQTGKIEDMMSELKMDEKAEQAAGTDDSTSAAPEPTEKTEEEKRQAEEKAKKEQAAREKELSGPKMQELQKAALHHFDDWREAVLLRIGEVVNQREEAVSQKKEAHAQTPRVPSKKAPESSKYDEGVSKALKEMCPPTETPLAKLEEQHRALILHSVLLLLLSLEHYSAHSRVLLLHLTSSLNLSIGFLADDESKIARGLLSAAEMKADDETKKKADDNQSSRKWKVGLASVAGAALIGVTGGLAAPLVAAGIGSVMGGLGLGATAAAGYLGTLASSSVIVGGLFGAYGGRMTGQMMDQYAKEVEDFSFVPVRTYHKPRKIDKEYRRLRVAIGISGWLTEKDEVVEPWKVIGPEMEAFALRFELQALLNLGNSLTTMIRSAAWGYAKSEIIKRTVFASLTAALWPLGLLKVSRIIDNPFSVAKARADKAGEVLADALINRAQGERPVTLIGYSLGARVIFTCLKSLAARKAFGLVENVVLLGAPTPSTAADWRLIRAVTTGRVVNVYSTSDYILGFLYRSSSIQYGVAGLEPVSFVSGVQNVDVTDLIAGSHTAYRYLCGRILRKIGFEDVDLAAVEAEEEALRKATASEEQERKANEVNTKEGASEAEVKEMEGKVQQKNEASMMDWASEKFKAGGASASSAANQAKNWVQRTASPKTGDQSASKDVGGAAGAVGGSLI
ncbi:DUF726-domain-containing protein [Aureobasidium pullulans]|uniref:DUF726-domain-containing protein n=1 Tax=Aureobasidium pullulans TaxID=5580 RepID=A0A4S9KLM0_AURPU|nr:DUF726-domain-containing protein [Aureobasidium pullulans]